VLAEQDPYDFEVLQHHPDFRVLLSNLRQRGTAALHSTTDCHAFVLGFAVDPVVQALVEAQQQCGRWHPIQPGYQRGIAQPCGYGVGEEDNNQQQHGADDYAKPHCQSGDMQGIFVLTRQQYGKFVAPGDQHTGNHGYGHI
jgi:hypothetical protein